MAHVPNEQHYSQHFREEGTNRQPVGAAGVQGCRYYLRDGNNINMGAGASSGAARTRRGDQEHANDYEEEEGFLCPITQEPMRDPVFCADGHSCGPSRLLNPQTRDSRASFTTLSAAHLPCFAHHCRRAHGHRGVAKDASNIAADKSQAAQQAADTESRTALDHERAPRASSFTVSDGRHAPVGGCCLSSSSSRFRPGAECPTAKRPTGFRPSRIWERHRRREGVASCVLPRDRTHGHTPRPAVLI